VWIGIFAKETVMRQGEWDVRIIRSGRKTVSLQIDGNLEITVRAPLGMPETEVRDFVERKSAWIEKHMQIMKERKAEQEEDTVSHLSMEEIRCLADEALDYIPQRVSFYAQQIHVSYGRITIRNQRSRWGSCSAKGNLNFNCLLMLMPPEVIDYVVVHELCHRLEMNHSKQFWQEVEKVLPDYKSRRKWLKENGGRIMRRMV